MVPAYNFFTLTAVLRDRPSLSGEHPERLVIQRGCVELQTIDNSVGFSPEWCRNKIW
jgi:hypothetical protein